MRIKSSFTFHLNNQVQTGLATWGRYDGRHLSITAATSGGKVLIYNAHAQLLGDKEVTQFLSISRRITALDAGRLKDDAAYDTLFIGTETNLLAYDVEQNANVFYKDVPDGVSAMAIGTVPPHEQRMVLVGGNCSIQGFDAEGTEKFWTVTGDSVSSITFADVDADGKAELLVGSQDFEIRAFKEENIALEITEADQVTHLSPMKGNPNYWAYGLSNGTVGVYLKDKRVWRVKAKHQVTALTSFDMNADGTPELVSGWSHGGLSVRGQTNGSIVYKDAVAAPVAVLLCGDYRLGGSDELVVCSTAGEVKGYPSLPPEESVSRNPLGKSSGDVDALQHREVLDSLQRHKQDLLMQLRTLEATAEAQRTGEKLGGSIPANTRISASLRPDFEKESLELTFSTNNDTVIVNVVVMDLEGALLGGSGEARVACPGTPSPQATMQLQPRKSQAANLQIQAHVGARGMLGTSMYVFELRQTIPKFARFAQIIDADSTTYPKAMSAVAFVLSGDPSSRVVSWIGQSFLLSKGVQTGKDGSFHVSFISICSDPESGKPEPLSIEWRKESQLCVKIRCNSMQLAGDILQDLCKAVQVTELESAADFKNEMVAFQEVLDKVSEHNKLRLRLAADMADTTQTIKNLIVMAEDARLLQNIPLMRSIYADLFALNGQLISEYVKRANNHQALLAALKEVNNMMQKASNLRMGTAKVRVISECRSAIKVNNVQALLQIIGEGRNPTAGFCA